MLTDIQYWLLVILCISCGFLIGFIVAYELYGETDEPDIKLAKKVFSGKRKHTHMEKCDAIMGMVERDCEDHNHY